jgi:hypothetical protein
MDAQLAMDLLIITAAAAVFAAGFLIGREWQKVENRKGR